MNWQDVLADPTLQNLPYKIELNEWGKIVMTPASNKHGYFQSEILVRLKNLEKDGKTFVECSVETQQGVKVADVVWISSKFYTEHGLETPYRQAPELCVEVISPSNSETEMSEKKDLYLERGAQEVWFCDEGGDVVFWNNEGLLSGSHLFPAFPSKISL